MADSSWFSAGASVFQFVHEENSSKGNMSTLEFFFFGGGVLFFKLKRRLWSLNLQSVVHFLREQHTEVLFLLQKQIGVTVGQREICPFRVSSCRIRVQ